jgi:hypothetical protein
MSKGTCISLAGYAVASVGTAILFFATPKEFPQGVVPVGAVVEVHEKIAKSTLDIAERQKLTRLGFAVLLTGTLMQLVGTALAAQ